MEKDSLTISLPRTMKSFVKAKLREGRFSTPSEYIRSLIRTDQDQSEQRDLEAFVRRGLGMNKLPELSDKDWAAVEALVLKRGSAPRPANNPRRTTRTQHS
jgi:antitoxin ParD1/3/4